MKILIADTQPIVIEGIKSLLYQFNNIQNIEVAENKESLISTLNTLKPEILIIDFALIPDFNFSEIKQIESISPETKLFVFTNNINENEILSILEFRSVRAIHLKNCQKIDFIRAVTVVANEGKTFCEKVIECLHNNVANKNSSSLLLVNNKKLTKREVEIVKQVAEGKTAKEIAEILFISIHTVNTYRKNIMKKLGVKNSSELIMFAIKTNLIDSTEYYI